jgi:hypothetical protein
VNTPAPAPYAGPQGPASMGAPLQPDPPPPPVTTPDVPHPDEEFQPGQMGWYSYHDHRDPEGTDRVQLVAVTHATDDHVHGVVLCDARQLASFARGVLTRQHPAAQ